MDLVLVGAHGIEPWTSFLHGAKRDAKHRFVKNALNLCVCMESDHVPLSYQESVLPVNYTRLNMGILTHPKGI